MKEKLSGLRRRLTIRQLRAFVAVAEHGTISAAAQRLGLTPPAVAQQLHALEDTLGVALVERGRDGSRPTDAGQEVLRAAGRIEDALTDCVEAIQALRGMEGGRASVGVISTAKYFAPRALAAFQRLYPRIEMRLLVGNRRETITALERYELDLAIMGRPPQHIELDQAVIGDHPHVIVAAPDHPLAGRAGLAMADIADDKLLMREPGSGTRQLAQSLYAGAGIEPRVAMEIGSNETIKQAVMAGMGIALISAHTISAELASGRLVTLDIKGLPIIRQWYVVKRREKRLLPAAHALWDHLERCGSEFLPQVTA
jgi:LysR family transcriptional regulator for metE and metH